MKEIVAFVLVFMMIIPSAALAHSGRTDANGGHNCSAKSKAKGLCTGYHYHNGGGSSSSGSSSNSSSHSSSSSSTKNATKNSSTASKSLSSPYKKASTSIYLNGNQLSFTDPSIVTSGTILVPLKAMADAIGASVQYDNKSKVIQLSRGNTTVVLVVNSKTMKVNNVASMLNAAPVIYNGISYVPIRVFSEGFGIALSYDSLLDRVTIEL